MTGQTLNIVIVDDDEFVGEIMSAGFENDPGFRIINCPSAVDFEESVTNLDIHGIVLDLFLPDINGMDLLKRIKADPKLRDIPVIVLSGVDDMAIRRKTIEAGAIHFITKPFAIADLKRLLVRVVGKSADPIPS